MFITAPISNPPALPPMAYMWSGVVNPSSTMAWPQSMKSVKVLILLNSLPSSYQWRPISLPPRMWAMAYTNPRSSMLKRPTENPASML